MNALKASTVCGVLTIVLLTGQRRGFHELPLSPSVGYVLLLPQCASAHLCLCTRQAAVPVCKGEYVKLRLDLIWQLPTADLNMHGLGCHTLGPCHGVCSSTCPPEAPAVWLALPTHIQAASKLWCQRDCSSSAGILLCCRSTVLRVIVAPHLATCSGKVAAVLAAAWPTRS